MILMATKTPGTKSLSRLSDRIASVLEETGMSARGWAIKAGVGESLVGQMKRGEVEAVDLAVVVTPERVYARSPSEWVVPPEPAIRRGDLVKVPGMRAIRLTDARRRVAFVLK